MTAPRAVLADLGETLLAERPMDRRASAEALVADTRFAPYLRDARAVEEAHAAGAARPETWTVLGWLRRMLPAALAEEAEILVWDRGVTMTPMTGAREALAALRAAKIPVGVVSSTLFSARVASRHRPPRPRRGLRRVERGCGRPQAGPGDLPRGARPVANPRGRRLVRRRLPREGCPRRRGGRDAADLVRRPPGPLTSGAVARDWGAFLELWKAATPRRVS